MQRRARHPRRHPHLNSVIFRCPDPVANLLIVHRFLLGIGIKHLDDSRVYHSQYSVHSVNIPLLADFYKRVLRVLIFFTPHMPLDIGIVPDVVYQLLSVKHQGYIPRFLAVPRVWVIAILIASDMIHGLIVVGGTGGTFSLV